MMRRVLVLGGGKKGLIQDTGYRYYVNVDINPRVGADVVHDLNQFPYPFKDEEFDEIQMDNVLEHLSDITKVLEELHRVSKPRAKITIVVPYFRSIWAWVDPTHKHCFTVDTLSYYDPSHVYCQRYEMSTTARFKILDRRFNQYIDKSWFRRLVLPLADRWPNFYETYFSHLYPMEDLTYHLEVIK